MSLIKAVTFDVGGTLIECKPSVGHIYAEVAARHGFKNLSPDALNRNFKKAWKSYSDFAHRKEDWAALVDKTFEGLVPVQSCATFFPDLYQRFTDPAVWHVYEDVFPAVNGLRERGFRLGIISNWDERLRPLLRQLGLEELFDPITISCEIGAQKPSPEIFEAAARGLDVRTCELLHVGDSYEMDVMGARRVSAQAYWLQREEQRKMPGTILSLAELNKL